MNTELGLCCRCGGEIGPPFDRNTDWLCKQCYDATHKVRPRAANRHGGESLPTPAEREERNKQQEKIDWRIDHGYKAIP